MLGKRRLIFVRMWSSRMRKENYMLIHVISIVNCESSLDCNYDSWKPRVTKSVPLKNLVEILLFSMKPLLKQEREVTNLGTLVTLVLCTFQLSELRGRCKLSWCPFYRSAENITWIQTVKKEKLWNGSHKPGSSTTWWLQIEMVKIRVLSSLQISIIYNITGIQWVLSKCFF